MLSFEGKIMNKKEKSVVRNGGGNLLNYKYCFTVVGTYRTVHFV